MTWIAATLWDLLAPPPRKGPKVAPAARPRGDRVSRMQQRYDELVAEMKRTHAVRVRKWRQSTSGCAWQVFYRDGSMVRLIESPYPRGPMSCAVFLHEIGHHAIGFGTYQPRCLEEYHAWQWALREMRERGFNVTERVEKRVVESLRYAVAKARRRGLKRVPPELVAYCDRPPAEVR